MVSQNSRIDKATYAVRTVVDQVLKIQQSDIAMLPVASVEARVDAIAAICRGLASIDGIRIQLVDRAFDCSGMCGGGGPAQERGVFSSVLRDAEDPGSDPLMQAVFAGRSRYIDGDAAELVAGLHFAEMDDRMSAIYIVPFISRAGVIGVLRAGTLNPEGIHEEIRIVLDLLAPQFALAIENALLYEQLNVPLRGGDPNQAQVIPDEPSVSSRDLVARLAHEIKTPLTTISTFIQLIPKKWDDQHFRTSFYPIARDETQRLSRLVNDMLDRGKNQSARLMPVDIQKLLNDLVARVSPLAEQRRLQFHTHFALASPVIRMDEGKIKEAIINLLDNAMEATPDAGHIGIRLEDLVMPGGRPAIQLEIQDSGPGIAKAIQDEIFDPYMSTKADDNLGGGTGLGLSIVRQNIQAHGGTIEVQSLDNAGALFRVILPVERRRR
jgi:signal transduction histidine kinase